MHVQMAEVALLVLDECHHCKKKHPANLIMQQFWHPSPPGARPRIFGMTASPVDTKKGPGGALGGKMQSLFAELEANLGAKVGFLAHCGSFGPVIALVCCSDGQFQSRAGSQGMQSILGNTILSTTMSEAELCWADGNASLLRLLP